MRSALALALAKHLGTLIRQYASRAWLPPIHALRQFNFTLTGNCNQFLSVTLSSLLSPLIMPLFLSLLCLGMCVRSSRLWALILTDLGGTLAPFTSTDTLRRAPKVPLRPPSLPGSSEVKHPLWKPTLSTILSSLTPQQLFFRVT